MMHDNTTGMCKQHLISDICSANACTRGHIMSIASVRHVSVPDVHGNHVRKMLENTTSQAVESILQHWAQLIGNKCRGLAAMRNRVTRLGKLRCKTIASASNKTPG